MVAPLVAVLILGSSPCAAAAARPAPTAGFIGEGGSYGHYDPATGDFLENGSRAPLPQPPVKPHSPPPLPTPAVPSINTVVAAPVPSSPRAAVTVAVSPARPAGERAVAAVPGEEGARRTDSLWNGLIQPLELSPEDVAAAAPDQARAASGRDYDARILGIRPSAARPPLALSGLPSPASLAGAAKLFVSVDIDARHGDFRDAVADLGAAAGFSADPRFVPRPDLRGEVRVSGWLSGSQLGTASRRPGVLRVRVEKTSRPSVPRPTSGEYLVGLIVDAGGDPRTALTAGLDALRRRANFQLTSVVGLETAADGRRAAVVSGLLPLTDLPRVLSMPEVAAVSVRRGVERASPANARSSFLAFAARKAPWLIVLTLALAIPGARRTASAAAETLHPYH